MYRPIAKLILGAGILLGLALVIGWRHFLGGPLGVACKSTWGCKDALECVDRVCSPSCKDAPCPDGWTCIDFQAGDNSYRKCRHPD